MNDWQRPLWLWRKFSWCVGDKHARRLTWLVRAYCWVFSIDVDRQFTEPPR